MPNDGAATQQATRTPRQSEALADAQREAQQRQAHQIGRRIASAREAIGATVRQLAMACDIDPSTIRYIELGHRLPSIFLLMTLCTRLRITPQYVLYGEMEMLPADVADRLAADHPELRFADKPAFLGKRGRPAPMPRFGT